MLTTVLAHAGAAPGPDDLWVAWNLDPLLLAGLITAGGLHARGLARRPSLRVVSWRAHGVSAALLVIAIALVSPLNAVSQALASAHMVQHLLLTLVAAPLLAFASPFRTIMAGSPTPIRRMAGRLSGRLRRASRRLGWVPGALPGAAAVWLLHVGVLWAWHGAALYDATLARPLVHVGEHAAFLVTGVLFWQVVTAAGRSSRTSPGVGIALLFTMALQGTFLALLLTFATTSWYAGYATTTHLWGLTPLADQRLAGAIMWVPGGFVYLAAALWLLAIWLRDADRTVAPDAAITISSGYGGSAGSGATTDHAS